jgi:KaiC/GvpD/RAD55 family RecA-like ATPase
MQLDIAVGLLRERRFEEAIEPLLKAIARDDENRRPWILLGEAYLRVDRAFKAAVAYLRALELSPNDEQAWLGLGRVLRFLDELPTAAKVLEHATRLHPEHADTWAERGLVLASMQKLPEALRSLGKALDLRPDHRVALAKRAEVEAGLQELGMVESEPTAATRTPEPLANPPAPLEAEILRAIDTSLEDEVPSPPMTELGEAPPAPPPERVRPPRVPTFVDGLDETMDGGIPWGHLVLIEGAPGTMKSSLAFSILLHNAAREGLHCLYLSLEERASSLLRQMGSLGLKLDVPKGSLIVLDPRTASDMISERGDWVRALEDGIRSIKEKRGLDLIVIDSLEALEVLAKFKDRRREMYRLFEWLRDLAVTSFVVTERPDWLIAGHVLQGRWDEDFLADAVIQLRIHMVSDLEAQRRLRIVKMRGAKHETGYQALVLDDGRFRVTRAMSP